MIKSEVIETKTFFENAKNNIETTTNRKDLLNNIANTVVAELTQKKRVNLNFICTHNSRRSQLAQVWAFYASEYFKLKNIFCFSGGTEATAFHRNTVKSLQKTGFDFNVIDFSHQNPRYLITFKNTNKSILGYSKTYDNDLNKQPFIAITTCSNADENCPLIPEAIHRFHLPYKDPKEFDGMQLQADKYLETSQQIAGEIFLIFKEITNQLKK
ncbi:hypothetical protein [Tenacibaculum sp. IB213877]|uniref:hypothetical protein n=1 Tax=Tenacibaculum sp. IB213877 TaxID=3097351 RepID=UPI002A5A2195|nr:hypothetical protein [Tenacibaculum sp. IB213877]MDY0781179.1 hypothetical protein [Tenacibaculum sp. IB213877]